MRLLTTAWEIEEAERFAAFLGALPADSGVLMHQMILIVRHKCYITRY
jgi:hypothetical protein